MPVSITITPIGVVNNSIPHPDRGIVWEEIDSEIVLRDDLLPALDGLEEFSHIWVIFQFQRERLDDGEDTDTPYLRLHPMGRADLPEIGVLATRSPKRPNPIGMTAVRLLARDGCTLRVRGLDAADQTPVLDIKPYLLVGDYIADSTAAEWARTLWAESRATP